METITLLKNFTFASDPGQSFTTDWIHFPASHVRADLVVSCKLFSPVGAGSVVNVQLQTTYDTDDVQAVGTAVGVTTPGGTTTNLTGGIGPMVRLSLSSGAPSAVFAVISVWLQPKTD